MSFDSVADSEGTGFENVIATLAGSRKPKTDRDAVWVEPNRTTHSELKDKSILIGRQLAHMACRHLHTRTYSALANMFAEGKTRACYGVVIAHAWCPDPRRYLRVPLACAPLPSCRRGRIISVESGFTAPASAPLPNSFPHGGPN